MTNENDSLPVENAVGLTKEQVDEASLAHWNNVKRWGGEAVGIFPYSFHDKNVQPVFDKDKIYAIVACLWNNSTTSEFGMWDCLLFDVSKNLTHGVWEDDTEEFKYWVQGKEGDPITSVEEATKEVSKRMELLYDGNGDLLHAVILSVGFGEPQMWIHLSTARIVRPGE